jgi:Suppressor of fused protein (SUFU)
MKRFPRPRHGLFQPLHHSRGDIQVIEAVTGHVERYVGSIDFVLHESRSHLVHVDVHHVAPGGRNRPFHTLVTIGMSQRAMTVPAGAESFAYAELFLLLPPEWDVSVAWPIRLLRQLARYPHEQGTWLGCGHTIRSDQDDPGGRLSDDVPFCAVLLTDPVALGGELAERRLPDRSIHFYQLIPLYREEIRFALRHGTGALLARFTQYQMSDIADSGRRNACRFDVY